MSKQERHCVKCGRKLYEGEGVIDKICGDCGLATLFGAMRGVVCVEKESGVPLTQKMVDDAVEGNKNDLQTNASTQDR